MYPKASALLHLMNKQTLKRASNNCMQLLLFSVERRRLLCSGNGWISRLTPSSTTPTGADRTPYPRSKWSSCDSALGNGAFTLPDTETHTHTHTHTHTQILINWHRTQCESVLVSVSVCSMTTLPTILYNPFLSVSLSVSMSGSVNTS